jgi:hypothetical protein
MPAGHCSIRQAIREARRTDPEQTAYKYLKQEMILSSVVNLQACLTGAVSVAPNAVNDSDIIFGLDLDHQDVLGTLRFMLEDPLNLLPLRWNFVRIEPSWRSLSELLSATATAILIKFESFGCENPSKSRSPPQGWPHTAHPHRRSQANLPSSLPPQTSDSDSA